MAWGITRTEEIGAGKLGEGVYTKKTWRIGGHGSKDFQSSAASETILELDERATEFTQSTVNEHEIR